MNLEPQVVYENKDFLVVNKPAGWLVHGIPKYHSKEPILIDWLKEELPTSILVHRLDKETSGVLLVALNQKTYEYFKKQFQEHKIKKTYLALVCGIPKEPEGVIEKPIGLKPDSVKRTVHTRGAKMVKEAITRYKVKKIFDDQCTLLEVEPQTGRTHQIRVHLASIGHPVVGDKLYGSKKRELKIDRQFLHAESLEFTAPDGRRLKFAADLPEDLESFLKNLET